MLRRQIALAIFVLAALAPTSALATTYYVSTGGSDGNAGTTTDKPFLTLAHAAGVTAPGDTVAVMSGTYGNPCSACDVVDITRSGSASGGYITYQAAAGQHPVIAFSGSYQAFNVQASYIAIEGFEIHGLDEASLTAAEAAMLGESSPKTNSTGINVGTSSLVTPFDHIVIKNNVVYGCSEAGIEVERSDYVTISGNTTYDNSNWSPYGGSGISLGYLADSDTNTGYKNYVTGNISYDNQMLVGEPAAGGTMADGNGIIIDDNENDQNGNPAYNGRTLVENNLAYENGGTGIHAFHSQHVDIVYNTAYANNRSADNSNGQISGILVNDVTIENNILYGVGMAKPISSQAANTSFTFDYNVLYDGDVLFQGAHDLVADPDFVNVGTDFHLAASSPAIDSASTKLTVATDLDGDARPVGAGYDRGCYEYAPPRSGTGDGGASSGGDGGGGGDGGTGDAGGAALVDGGDVSGSGGGDSGSGSGSASGVADGGSDGDEDGGGSMTGGGCGVAADGTPSSLALLLVAGVALLRRRRR